MLGGSAVHFALAASFFTDVHVVGPVGDDFGEEHVELLSSRGVDVDRHRAGRRRPDVLLARPLRGRPQRRPHRRHAAGRVRRLRAEALRGVERARTCLFLGNIQPDLQRRVRAQCDSARLAALDSMNLWIETTRDSLIAAVGEVDCVMLNDAEVRMLTEEPNLARAARALMEHGPPNRGRQARRVRRGAVHGRRRPSRSRASCSRTSATPPAPATASPAASSAISTCRGPSAPVRQPCAGRSPTGPCSPRSTSRSSAPSALLGSRSRRSRSATSSCAR